MLRTELTRALGIRRPLIGAPMAGVSGGALARAISEAGGLGMIGIGSTTPVEFLEEQAELARGAGDTHFGIGLMAWALETRPELLAAALAAGPRLVSISFGSPGPWADEVKRAGVVLAAQVHDRGSAREALSAGADFVVAQGTEAGGHTGTVSTLPLLQLLLREAPGRVLAAGGIAAPAGVAACLAAGAEGVWVGTAFIPCPESLGWDEAKRTVLQAGERDTVHTHLFDRLQSIPWPDPYPGRALRNRYTDRWHGREEAALADPAVLEQYRRAGRDHDVEVAHVYAGQAVGLVDTARPAAEVVRDLMDGAEALLRRRTEDLLG